jgi:hypothetical protein
MDIRQRQLRELGALIEQISVETPLHQEIALLGLQAILQEFRSEPSQHPAVRMPVNSRPVPLPQIWIPSEPIPEHEVMPLGVYPGGSEKICFDRLDSTQLERVLKVPFLFHEDMT